MHGIQEPNHEKKEIKLKSVTNFSVFIDVHHRNIVNKEVGIEFGSVDSWQVLPGKTMGYTSWCVQYFIPESSKELSEAEYMSQQSYIFLKDCTGTAVWRWIAWYPF